MEALTIRAILFSEWLCQEMTYVYLFQSFLLGLVLEKEYYLRDMLWVLINNFTYRMFNTSSNNSNALTLYSAPPSIHARTRIPLITPKQFYQRAHQSLRHLTPHLNLTSASGMIVEIFKQNFPLATESTLAHIMYVQNIITALKYIPEVREETVNWITLKIVKFDQEARTDRTTLPETMTKDLIIREKIEKVDGRVDLLFTHLTRIVASKDREDCWDMLLKYFRWLILPNPNSTHAQFILFHFVQQEAIWYQQLSV